MQNGKLASNEWWRALLNYLSKKFVAQLECFLAGVGSLPFRLEAEFGCIWSVVELRLALSLEECNAGAIESATGFFIISDKALLLVSPSLAWFNNLPVLYLMIFCFSTCIKDITLTRMKTNCLCSTANFPHQKLPHVLKYACGPVCFDFASASYAQKEKASKQVSRGNMELLNSSKFMLVPMKRELSRCSSVIWQCNVLSSVSIYKRPT